MNPFFCHHFPHHFVPFLPQAPGFPGGTRAAAGVAEDAAAAGGPVGPEFWPWS